MTTHNICFCGEIRKYHFFFFERVFSGANHYTLLEGIISQAADHNYMHNVHVYVTGHKTVTKLFMSVIL